MQNNEVPALRAELQELKLIVSKLSHKGRPGGARTAEFIDDESLKFYQWRVLQASMLEETRAAHLLQALAQLQF